MAKKFFDLQRFQDFTNSNPNKTIKGSNEDDWIVNSGSIVKIYGNSGKDTVQNSGNLVTVFGGADSDSIKNTGSNVTISGDAGNDYISISGGSSISASGGEGTDYVYNYGNSRVTLTGGAGNDTIHDDGGNYHKIFGGEGNDSVRNRASYSTVSGGLGNDCIINDWRDYVLLSGDEGNDGIFTYEASHLTINGGKGNDYISLRGSNYNTVQYIYGEGNDTVFGFKDSDTLYITTPKKFSSVKGGNDVYFTFDNDEVLTLKNVGDAHLNIVTIAGGNQEGWEVSGTTATYKNSAGKTLITLKGLKSGLTAKNGAISGISLKNKTVTLSKNVLGKKTVKLTGNYNLALASDVTKSVTKSAGWTVSGTTANYKTKSITMGYSLAANKKSVSYLTASGGKTLVTVSGLKSGASVKKLSLSGKNVTIDSSIIGAGGASVKGSGYTFALNDAGKMKNIGGAAVLQGSSGKDTLIGGKKADTLIGGKGNDSLTGGKGSDLFVYSAGNDTITDYTEKADLIRLDGVYVTGTKADGKNAILQTGKGNITVLNGVGKTLSVITDIKVSSSSALSAENNFSTADNLSAIVKNNSVVTDYKIEPQNFDALTQKNNLITYAEK